MNAPRIIDDAIAETQNRASNPDVSAFVSANAGAGKTHVLVQRVIRLLLKGTAPEKILCITFTKAAAANMAQRVFETLGRWIALDDAQLDDALRRSGILHPDRTTRHDARKLFARALETPGGLKVQTIHALCTRLLQQFPFESNVPARFAVIDDRDQSEMMERASLRVLLEAAAQPDSVNGRALATAMMNAADVTLRDVVRQACLSRDHFMAWSDAAGTVDSAISDLSKALGIAPGETIETITDAILDGPNLPRADWLRIAGQFDGGSKQDHAQAERLRVAMGLSGQEQTDRYLSVFFTGTGDPRKSLATKAVAKLHPALPLLLADEQSRLERLCAARAAVKIRDRTEALLVIAGQVASHYRHEKQERGLLDYDDLIDKTLKLLNDASAGWVHYKLDRGIDHVLIDEAQDTSPKQWEIVTRLVDDFTSGAGARDGLTRTIFAVGDEKQSIFSFQGAAPREFDERKGLFQRKFTGANLKFDPVKFTYSFRSGVSILQSVQATFRGADIYRSITSDKDGMPPHLALKDAAPSVVDLWDLEEPGETQDMEGWRAPFDAVAEQSPEVKLAQRMARQISELIGSGHSGRSGARRNMTAGDILVLVRRRGKLFDAVIQALKHAGVPVAGADRLKLTEHIAIIDLMNLADAILLPEDDLALAVALKSPVFGVTEEQLFALAHGRRGTLRQSLTEKARSDEAFARILNRLETCEARAMNGTPFSFYAWLLGGDGGRHRIFQRLNHEPGDALDEFLQLALTYEQREPASLQGFMAWLRAADIEIKRDMELSRDEVRVMTVHGSKGLEAPVVFLMDTTSSPADTQCLNLIRLPHSGCVVWGGRKADDPPAVAEARAQMAAETENEYRRLLYVAMTRAAERLVIGGTMPGNRNEVSEGWWYHLVRNGLENSDLTVTMIDTPDGVVRRYARPDDLLPLDEPVQVSPPEPLEKILPAWLRQPATAAEAAFDLRRPSDPGDHEGLRLKRGEADAVRRKALQRGNLTHRLLQSLPDIPVSRRAEAAAQYLLRNTGDTWLQAERDALAQQVIGLMADSRFAALFAAGSRAEVSIAGRLDRPDRAPLFVSGQIDRLVIHDDQILIADYKTNHAPPHDAAKAPPAYRQQLALYRAVLMKLYPGRTVRGLLVWTEAPEIMEISAAAMDAEMMQIISA